MGGLRLIAFVSAPELIGQSLAQAKEKSAQVFGADSVSKYDN